MERSTNVQGFNYHQGNLYVHLGRYMATVYLTKNNPNLPYLLKATGPIEDWRCSPVELHFEYAGWSPGKVIVKTGTPGMKAIIEIRDKNSSLFVEDHLSADKDGRLIFNLLSPGAVTARLSGS